MSSAMEINFNALKKMIPQLGVTRLKDLIKSIRNCKTAADERAVIAKESAFIRTSFKEENVEIRAINIAKLLYIHMLGYSAHFGQIECLKLGYLGTMMLLDENQEVLTLVTNCLKNDMNNSNMYIVSLALSTLGNISSPEMSRDLSNEVERLLGSSNAYIRKKAALCAVRIIKKVPDLIENFLSRARNLLNERTHGPLLTGLTLLIEMCVQDPAVIEELQNIVPTLVKHLKSLATPGYSPEHDVNGITDPFIQVKILRLLRIIGKGNVKASDTMNDVLAQVATTTESSKNVGNSILYETVLTIMETESDSSLRVLAINILGKFLSNRDNNIKYVALTTLTRTAQTTMATDASALQRHRTIILDCLRDPDISIRKRALDLCFHLMNGSNIRILTRELLSFLETCDGDTKSAVSSKICEYAGRFRPSPRWEIDTVIRVLRVAGAWVDQGVINYLVKLVTNCSQDLQQYTVKRLYQIVALEGEKALLQEGLLQALFWNVGEYGDLLIHTNLGALGSDEDSESDMGQPTPSEQEVIDFTHSILKGPYATSFVKEYAITGLAKLSSRFTNTFVIENIKQLIAQYTRDMEVELQQRAVEYGQIFGFDYETRVALLERMPVLESAAAEEKKKGSGNALQELSPVRTRDEKTIPTGVVADIAGLDLLGTGNSAPSNAGNTGSTATGANLYDMVFGNAPTGTTGATLNSDLAGLGDLMSPTPANTASTVVPMASTSLQDNVLGDLFGSIKPSLVANPLNAAPLTPTTAPILSATPASQPVVPASTTPTAIADPLADILGGALSSNKPPSLQNLPLSSLSLEPTQVKHVCYDKKGLRIELLPKKESAVLTHVTCVFVASSGSEVSEIVLQVAVPKTLKLQMLPPESNIATLTHSPTQSMKIENPTQVPIRLRLKLSFKINGSKVDDIAEFSSFDSSLWS